MIWRELGVPAPLAPWVSTVWELRAGDAPVVNRVVPDGSVDVVLRDGLVSIAGVNSVAFVVGMEAGERAVGVRFRPGAAPGLLGVPADELRDEIVTPAELWGRRGAELARRAGALDLRAASRGIASRDAAGRRAVEVGGGVVVAGERDGRRVVDDAAAALLTDWLAWRARDAATPDPAVLRAAGLLGGSRRTRDVAEAVGFSERQLRRRIIADVGYGPKRLARVLRFQQALKLARAPEAELAGVAVAAGYADQAHFTRECTALAGVPPAALLAERRG